MVGTVRLETVSKLVEKVVGMLEDREITISAEEVTYPRVCAFFC
jgi:hypothetical protein